MWCIPFLHVCIGDACVTLMLRLLRCLGRGFTSIRFDRLCDARLQDGSARLAIWLEVKCVTIQYVTQRQK